MSTGTRRRSPSLLALLPYLILMAASLFLAWKWDSLPPRWPSHWGRGGVPNGWSTRTIGGVFGPLLFILPVLLILEIFAAIVRRRVRQQPLLAPLGDATLGMIHLIAVGMSAFFAFIFIALPLRASAELPPFSGPVLAFLVVPIIFGLARIYRTVGYLRAAGSVPEGYTGIFYRNAKDSRLWVPKLLGPGLTLNMAHPWAWPILVAMVAGPLTIAVIAILLIA
jgi:uncharacterized membrane protein